MAFYTLIFEAVNSLHAICFILFVGLAALPPAPQKE
jgi:hypothetical protein